MEGVYVLVAVPQQLHEAVWNGSLWCQSAFVGWRQGIAELKHVSGKHQKVAFFWEMEGLLHHILS